jgi:hypothetical protein
VTHALDALVKQQYLWRFGEFYSVEPAEASVVRRLKGNSEAQRYLPLAAQQARFISKFPFVRAVMASGSLSKNYMDENSDFDFFIVTAPNRLWISRTLLVSYKRYFLKNSHKHFCVNYFIDANHLEIEEKNLFTATELATVLPLQGGDYYKKLMDVNSTWLSGYFPNAKVRDTRGVPSGKPGFWKRVIEKGIDVFLGVLWENMLMKLTMRRWKKLYATSYNSTDFTIAFKTKKHVSKNHPQNFQKKVMAIYKEKLEAFNKKFDLE